MEQDAGPGCGKRPDSERCAFTTAATLRSASAVAHGASRSAWEMTAISPSDAMDRFSCAGQLVRSLVCA